MVILICPPLLCASKPESACKRMMKYILLRSQFQSAHANYFQKKDGLKIKSVAMFKNVNVSFQLRFP